MGYGGSLHSRSTAGAGLAPWQKIKVKKKLRRRWRDSDNATLQIAEFKLCSDDEELARLNTQKVNADIAVTGKGRVIMEMPDDADATA